MNKKIYDALFIADLHLSAQTPECNELARRFFTEVAPQSNTLFILGDLVEYWLGDDSYDGSLDTAFKPLGDLASLGTTSYLMHGNRDFLLGEQFCSRFNLELIREDHYLLQSGRGPVLLMHGDTLCTDDVDYQGMRTLLRSEKWQQDFLALPVSEREEQARRLRAQSVEATAEKQDEICDVNAQTVIDTLKDSGVLNLIHGHTHRPDVHAIELDGRAATRWVVGDWHPEGAVYARLQNNEISLDVFK